MTTTTRPRRGLATPEAASKNLWDAWRDDDRPRALVAATPAAVEALFGDAWGAEIHNQGCAALSANTYRCAFVGESTAKIVTVVGGAANGFRSTRVDEMANAALATLVPMTTAVPDTVPADSIPAGVGNTAVSTPGAVDTIAGGGGVGGAAVARVDGGAAASSSLPPSDPAAEAPTIATTAPARRTPRSTVRRVARTSRPGRTTSATDAPAATAAPSPATTPAAGDGRVSVNAPVTQVSDGNG